MLYVILTICFIGNVILVFKLSNIETENLGKISSLKLELKRKEEEIKKLKNKINEIKNINVDVEI